MKETIYHHILFAIRSVPAFGLVGSLKLLLAFWTNLTVKIQQKGYLRGFYMRGGTSDPILVYNIFTRKEYPLIDDPSVRLIIDAGANAGYATIYFAHNYPKAKIIALEPEHSNYLQLKRNTEGYANVEVLEKGLWFRPARLKVSNPSSEKWGFIFEEVEGDGVPCSTMPILFEQYHSSGGILVKMDIEGAESQIFEKDPSWIGLTDYIFIEIHNGWKSIFDALSKTDYEAWISSENVIIKLFKNKR